MHSAAAPQSQRASAWRAPTGKPRSLLSAAAFHLSLHKLLFSLFSVFLFCPDYVAAVPIDAPADASDGVWHHFVARAKKEAKKIGFSDKASGVPVYGWMIIGILIGLIIGWGLSFCYWHQSKPSSKKASSMAYGGY